MFYLEIRARPCRAELAGSQSGTEVRIALKRGREGTRDREWVYMSTCIKLLRRAD